ncbi:IS1380 family transposase [Paeniglutamicibacter sp. Y32M11]|uniref:IS1380 family transposase n=1 Tax=Paeniglutamicibacter sp. Y32M11 TaxID=2853258 RepID=UPI001C52F9E2|nr:IS1380 family transposase [Paeniglutamicibacter sp. Y32M11]QXQ08758.1 IS1380 family transposase [Paeniglutamicibacter sp. Y32M11]
MLNDTHVFPSLPAALTSQSLISHAGLNVLTSFVDATGFAALCEDRFSQFVPDQATHRPGRILGSLALMLAGGGEHVSDLDVLRNSPGLFGAVPSNATVSRFVARATEQPEAFAHGFTTLSRRLRSRIWEAAGKRNPAALATQLDPLTVDIDATLVTAHSEKQGSAGTYKGGYGFSPMIASIDYGKDNGTGEILAAMLRPGNKGANSASDHIKVLEDALAQLPDSMHDEQGNLDTARILVRTDSAGASREFLHHLHSLGLQFSTSFALPVPNERFIHWINNKEHWELALDQSGSERHDAWVIDATKVIELKKYPEGTRLYLRAEPLHPGAKASLFDLDGHRVTAFLTNAPRYNVAFLDARHRARARCENRIKTLKNAGLGKLPFTAFAANQLWSDLAVLAVNLVSWMQITLLPAGHAAGVWDMKRWHYRLFSMAGKLISSARKRRLLIPKAAPESQLFTTLIEGSRQLQHRWQNVQLTA